jgi:hypothetical protein
LHTSASGSSFAPIRAISNVDRLPVLEDTCVRFEAELLLRRQKRRAKSHVAQCLDIASCENEGMLQGHLPYIRASHKPNDSCILHHDGMDICRVANQIEKEGRIDDHTKGHVESEVRLRDVAKEHW